LTNKNSQLIWVSRKNHDILKNAGTITDSFDSVISRLIEDTGLDKKVAQARGVLAGSTEPKATTTVTEPLSAEGAAHKQQNVNQ